MGGLSVCLVSGGRGGRVGPLDWLANKVVQNVGGVSLWINSVNSPRVPDGSHEEGLQDGKWCEDRNGS